MTQEQYNRYMDGLILKVASKRLSKTASFRKRADEIQQNADKVMNRMNNRIRSLPFFSKVTGVKAPVDPKTLSIGIKAPVNLETFNVANNIASLAKQTTPPDVSVNYLENPKQIQDVNNKIERIELENKAQMANSNLHAFDTTNNMTEKAINKIDAQKKLLQMAKDVSKDITDGKIKYKPEAPSWYSKAYEWVKANPKTSLAIGGGVVAGGLLLAYLMRKREKDAKKQKAVRKHKFIAGNPSLAFA